MSLIVEYGLQSERLVLAPTLDAVDVRLVLERTVGTDPARPILFAWAEGDLSGFEAALTADPTVADVTVLNDGAGSRLYRFQVTDETELVTHGELARLGASRLEATFDDGWWHARTRFPDGDAFDSYASFLEAAGAELRVRHRYDADGTDRELDGLTEPQRETLRLAYRRGYFSVPRTVTAAALAEELGVSSQAVSERLRRGYARLVERSVSV
jgi:predicted DNA binding protein